MRFSVEIQNEMSESSCFTLDCLSLLPRVKGDDVNCSRGDLSLFDSPLVKHTHVQGRGKQRVHRQASLKGDNLEHSSKQEGYPNEGRAETRNKEMPRSIPQGRKDACQRKYESWPGCWQSPDQTLPRACSPT